MLRIASTLPIPKLKYGDKVVERIINMIRLAAEFGAKVNTGRVRGVIHDGENPKTARQRYIDCIERCADIAEPLGVELIVEPVNRYEVNFINNCAEGLDIVRETGRRCVRLMPDTFHMNIEDTSFRDAIMAAKDFIGYLHLADWKIASPRGGDISSSTKSSTHSARSATAAGLRRKLARARSGLSGAASREISAHQISRSVCT